MIIQNADTIFLKVQADTNEVYLPKERFLTDRKIFNIIPFFSEINKIARATDDVQLLDSSFADSIYFDGYELGKDYKTKNLNIKLLTTENYNKYNINSILDYDISTLKIKKEIQTNAYVGLVVVYSDEFLQIQTPIQNTITFVVKKPQKGIIKLSEIGGYQLNGKRIKQIVTTNDSYMYLTIRTKDNKNNINELPLYMLNNRLQFGDSKILFDSLNIDTDNSYIYVCSNKEDNLIITFKY